MTKQELRLECLKLAAARVADIGLMFATADKFVEYAYQDAEKTSEPEPPGPKGRVGKKPENVEIPP